MRPRAIAGHEAAVVERLTAATTDVARGVLAQMRSVRARLSVDANAGAAVQAHTFGAVRRRPDLRCRGGVAARRSLQGALLGLRSAIARVLRVGGSAGRTAALRADVACSRAVRVRLGIG